MKYLKARKARETKECNIKKEYAIEKVKCSKILLSKIGYHLLSFQMFGS